MSFIGRYFILCGFILLLSCQTASAAEPEEIKTPSISASQGSQPTNTTDAEAKESPENSEPEVDVYIGLINLGLPVNPFEFCTIL